MKEKIKLAVVMDPINQIYYQKDTTLALLWAAQARNWSLYYLEIKDLFLQAGEAWGNARILNVKQDPNDYYHLGEPKAVSLTEFDCILMRKDPPVDEVFINATQILAFAERAGVLVVNPTDALRNCNEKLYAQQFPECVPPTLVTSQTAAIRQFHAEYRDIILKPLDGMGGSGVFRVAADGLNLAAIIEQLTQHNRRQIMVQRYLAEIAQGDTRILVIDGEPVPYGLARIPAQGEVRGNLAAGGHGVARALVERDYWLIEQVKPSIQSHRLLLVGLDVIGGYLTEINLTSPTCAREIQTQTGIDAARLVLQAIYQRLS